MSTRATPVFRELDRAACEEILKRNHVGRLAYARANLVDIEPIHYVYDDGWIYGRTSEGTKLLMTGYAWHPVAFEVDEIEDLFRWRSVVVHGGFYTIPLTGAAWEVDEWKRGVELLRTLVPDTFREGDPVGFRTILFRIAAQEVRGREALPGGPGSPAAGVTTSPPRAPARSGGTPAAS
jgi:nitroimidazol reductase NimA-like FMN-containing flavoprotein (pyridoxamine 5'-phosphate oxidase superfamily)